MGEQSLTLLASPGTRKPNAGKCHFHPGTSLLLDPKKLHWTQLLLSPQSKMQQGSCKLTNVTWARQVSQRRILPTHSLGILDKFQGQANSLVAYDMQPINPTEIQVLVIRWTQSYKAQLFIKPKWISPHLSEASEQRIQRAEIVWLEVTVDSSGWTEMWTKNFWK